MQKQNSILQGFSLVWQGLSVENIFRAGIFLVATWFVYFAIATIFMPYPIEYREGVSQVLTQLLLDGENPFSAANQPLALTSLLS